MMVPGAIVTADLLEFHGLSVAVLSSPSIKPRYRRRDPARDKEPAWSSLSKTIQLSVAWALLWPRLWRKQELILLFIG